MKEEIYHLQVKFGIVHVGPSGVLNLIQFSGKYKSIKTAVDSLESFLSIIGEENPFLPMVDIKSIKIYYNKIYRSFRSVGKFKKDYEFPDSQLYNLTKPYKPILQISITPEYFNTVASTRDELLQLIRDNASLTKEQILHFLDNLSKKHEINAKLIYGTPPKER